MCGQAAEELGGAAAGLEAFATFTSTAGLEPVAAAALASAVRTPRPSGHTLGLDAFAAGRVQQHQPHGGRHGALQGVAGIELDGVLHNLNRRAQQLDMTLVPTAPAAQAA